ncbi:LamG-like jellyroll fold domain-containing protein [Dysgonomonas reticulitermitis]
MKAKEQMMIVAAHRCNEISKLSAAIDYGIENFEVDIHVQVIDGVPTLMIGHEIATATGQTFEDYIGDLMSMYPEFKFLWLDMKDLKSIDNEALIKEVLNKLDDKYSIKHRVLVESQYIQYLTSFANEGWTVSFYCSWSSLQGKTPEQQKVICDEWLQSMQKYNVDGISFDATVYEVIRDNFAGKTVNDRIVKQYSWDLSLSYTTPDLDEKLQKYTSLSVLLIVFSAKITKKIITDVEFAENGVATNMGEPIDSLPVQPGVNKIETQYNSTYNKYEAKFDGTNFFYIPYQKDDIIGNALSSGKFSMELLFTPDEGGNPFASMEYGGLGYELTKAGDLEFWYNADNKYVLPGDSFKTKVQLGENIYYHVFVTYNGTVFKLYVDGTKIKEEAVSGQFTFPQQNQSPQLLFGIGADYIDKSTLSFQNPFTGRIIHAKLYDEVLNELEIKRITESAIPQLITDVEFAENGVATNMGKPIDSLPVQSGVNKIETQYNSSYNKYEAKFDGTNFFYIPYSKDDVIGDAIQNDFSMELLFTPDGGINPFASMEYGGLGYELTKAEDLEFWYNMDGQYVLPGEDFKTGIQLGKNIYYHVIVTYDGITFKMYIDGIKVKEESASGQFTFPRQNESPQLLLGIGADYVDRPIITLQSPFIGKIVHAKIYRGALSEWAIKNLTENISKRNE